MSKTILITGSTDGIGLETAQILLKQGHRILLHGRSLEKIQKIESKLSKLGMVESFVADLSDLKAVKALAKSIIEKHNTLDVLINNAGILKTPDTRTADGLDTRFAVNTIAPYILTKNLLPILGDNGRVINLSSAAQSPVDLNALMGNANEIEAMSAYSQSKLAITMWSCAMAELLGNKGPIIVAVNPGSLLKSKMVKEAFGIAGKDIRIGVDILVRISLSDDFLDASGKYFDNDYGNFTNPHLDALNKEKCNKLIKVIELIIA